MTSFNIVIILVAVGGFIVGYREGFARIAGRCAALVVALLATCVIGQGCTMQVKLLIFLAAMLVTFFAASLLHKFLHWLKLGPVDSIAGAILASGLYTVVISVLINLYIWVMSLLPSHGAPSFQGQPLVKAVVGIAPWLLDKLSSTLKALPALLS